MQQDLSVKIRQDVVHFKFAEAQDKVPHEITKQEAKELLEYKEAKRYKRYASEPKIKNTIMYTMVSFVLCLTTARILKIV